MPKLTEILPLRQKPQMQLGSSAVAQMQVYLILKHVYITYHTKRLSTIDRNNRITKIIFLKSHSVSQIKIVFREKGVLAMHVPGAYLEPY